jgi:hypothetical protein
LTFGESFFEPFCETKTKRFSKRFLPPDSQLALLSIRRAMVPWLAAIGFTLPNLKPAAPLAMLGFAWHAAVF